MASYFSSLLTTTTSRVASIRQNLLPTENDGDTEDDTHLCRVLRAYYTEKGRSFPAWLPPDPKAPPPVVVTPVYSQSNVGARYGGMQTAPGGGSALSSLWDSQPAQPPPEQQSLRQGRGAPTSSRFGAQASGGGQRQNPFARQQQQLAPEQVQARPLPSQRAGSYQTAGAGFNQTPPGSSSGPMSAKDRLAGRLGQKGRAASPANTPPPRMAESAAKSNGYGSSNAGGNYEDRFAPPSGAGYGSSGGGGGGDKPFMAATSPWASSEAEFGGGGYGGGYDAPPARTGLPSGPGAGRRGPGLPSGPRGMR